jgi:hypothetical protein
MREILRLELCCSDCKDMIRVPEEGKYENECAVCGGTPTDKKWAGQYFHKKCMRKLRKGAGQLI